MISSQAFGQQLRELRVQRGLSLREVERISVGEISSSHLSQVENGKISQPSLIFLRALGKVYNRSLADLLNELGIVDEYRPDTGQQQHLLRAYRELDPAQQRSFLAYLQALVGIQRQDLAT